jgi:hypothetical protein
VQFFLRALARPAAKEAAVAATQIISGNLIWTELINGERKKNFLAGGERVGRGHTGASGRRGRDVTS